MSIPSGVSTIAFERAAAYEVRAPERLDLFRKSEGARGRNLAHEGLPVERVESHVLHAYQGVSEIYQTVYLPTLLRLDRHAPLALLDLHARTHAQRAPRGGLLNDARPQDHLREVVRRAVHDRKLQVVNLYVRVVNAESAQSGEQMLDGREHNARAHQRRRVRAVRDALDGGRNLEVVQICAYEDVACVGRRGPQPQVHGRRRVKSEPARLDGLRECGLFYQGCPYEPFLRVRCRRARLYERT